MLGLKLIYVTKRGLLLQYDVDGLVQDCCNPIANAVELPQSCIKPSISLEQ